MADRMIWTVINPPNEALSEIIRKALNEDEDKLQNNVKLLEEWISCQDYLPKNYDRRILPGYIRGAKHILENAKQKIERYFIARTIHKDLFDNRILTIEDDLFATSLMHSATMPDLSPEGYRVTYIKLINNDLFDPMKILRLATIFAEFRTHEENFTAGEILVIDCEKVSASTSAKMLTQLNKIVMLMQDSFPVLVKQIHVITDNAVLVNAANLLKKCLKEKLRNRMHFHKSYEGLADFIPKEYLPKDYNGTQASLSEVSAKWRDLMSNSGPLFKKIDEVKLTGPIPKDSSYNMRELEHGVEGSFRKLNID